MQQLFPGGSRPPQQGSEAAPTSQVAGLLTSGLTCCAQALASSINDTANTVAGLPDFAPYLSALDAPASACAALPPPKSKVLTDAEDAITSLIENISSVSRLGALPAVSSGTASHCTNVVSGKRFPVQHPQQHVHMIRGAPVQQQPYVRVA